MPKIRNKVSILQVGYCREEQGGNIWSRANGTATLIQTTVYRDDQTDQFFYTVVDTLTQFDRDKMASEIQKMCHINNVDLVINTHNHADHVGCNSLFNGPNILFVAGSDYDFVKMPSVAAMLSTRALDVISCPGHTLDSIAVIVNSVNCLSVGSDDIVKKLDGDVIRVAVAGDTFECAEDVVDGNIWRLAGSQDPNSQVKYRLHLASNADFIIPGHGYPFQVDGSVIEQLKSEADNPIFSTRTDDKNNAQSSNQT